MAINKKNQIYIANEGPAIKFLLHKCLTGSSSRVGSSSSSSRMEILTIIMLTPTVNWTLVWGWAIRCSSFSGQRHTEAKWNMYSYICLVCQCIYQYLCLFFWEFSLSTFYLNAIIRSIAFESKLIPCWLPHLFLTLE